MKNDLKIRKFENLNMGLGINHIEASFLCTIRHYNAGCGVFESSNFQIFEWPDLLYLSIAEAL